MFPAIHKRVGIPAGPRKPLKRLIEKIIPFSGCGFSSRSLASRKIHTGAERRLQGLFRIRSDLIRRKAANVEDDEKLGRLSGSSAFADGPTIYMGSANITVRRALSETI